jgi:hypothetical protein
MSGNAVSLKSANKLAILRCFLKQSPLTKAEVAHLTQLTFATVSNLLTELQAEGWIQEAGYAQSNGGRKPVLYAIRSTAAAFIGISLQLKRLTGVLTDPCGRVLAEWSEPFDFSDGPQRAVADIQRLCAGLLEAAGCRRNVWRASVCPRRVRSTRRGVSSRRHRICPAGATCRCAT